MMGNTHISIGIAAALAVTAPATPGECLPAILGGALGGMLSDIDIRSGKRLRDVSQTRMLAVGIAVVCLFLDSLFGGKLWSAMTANEHAGTGALLLGLLCLFGSVQEHRGFTHSLLALVLFTGCVSLVCPPLLLPFGAGFASHLALDSLNKKPIRLFYPLKTGLCLKLCYADGRINALLLRLGLILSVLLLLRPLFISF